MSERTAEPGTLGRSAGRLLLAVFGTAEIVIGGWAVTLPKAFYDRFPGFGWHWVSASGPYDEHLVRDFGGALAGLAVVALICAAKPGRALVLAMVGGWEIEAVPHLVYHLLHQDALPAAQNVISLVTLALAVAVPLVAGALLWPIRPAPSLPSRRTDPG